jgi:hypothetical protein
MVIARWCFCRICSQFESSSFPLFRKSAFRLRHSLLTANLRHAFSWKLEQYTIAHQWQTKYYRNSNVKPTRESICPNGIGAFAGEISSMISKMVQPKISWDRNIHRLFCHLPEWGLQEGGTLLRLTWMLNWNHGEKIFWQAGSSSK